MKKGAARWARRLAAAGYALQRPFLRRRVGRLVIERVDGVPILVLPEVFNPRLFRTGAWLARAIPQGPNPSKPPHRQNPPTPLTPRKGAGAEAADDAAAPRALDMGTGSGIGAVFAARLGYRVTAIDVNPHAVRCARLNALLNGLEDRIEVLHGDLFAPLLASVAPEVGASFDLVLFNPPFFPGAPGSALDAAWRGEGVIERFAAELPHFLAPGGRALLLVSSAGASDRVLVEHLKAAGLAAAPVVSRSFAGEVISIWEAAAAGGAAGGDVRERLDRESAALRGVVPQRPPGQRDALHDGPILAAAAEVRCA